MKNLKDFINNPVYSSDSKELSEIKALTNITRELSSANIHDMVIPHAKAAKFSKNLIKLANSDEVISELSNAVGDPIKNESEDEFVARAKKILKNILKNKLS